MWHIPCGTFLVLLSRYLQTTPGIQSSKYIDPPEDNVYLGAVLTFVVVVTGIFAYYQVLYTGIFAYYQVLYTDIRYYTLLPGIIHWHLRLLPLSGIVQFHSGFQVLYHLHDISPHIIFCAESLTSLKSKVLKFPNLRSTDPDNRSSQHN